MVYFLASRFMAAYMTTGSVAVFPIITAIIIGGATLRGGRGSIAGTFLGLILMAVINNALVFLGIEKEWGNIILGILLITVVIIDVNFNKERI